MGEREWGVDSPAAASYRESGRVVGLAVREQDVRSCPEAVFVGALCSEDEKWDWVA